MLAPALFFADAATTAIAAWLLVCASGHAGRGPLEAALAWAWAGVALIAGTGVILGMTGGFGPAGFLVFHFAILVSLVLARHRQLGDDGAALALVCRQARNFFNATGADRYPALGAFVLLTVLAGLTAVAALAQPAVMDAVTYHLPRVGHWLQEGEIGIIGSSDTRLNFVAVLPDIVMAWFLGGSREGYALLVLSQSIGGIMAVGATIALARQTGLGRGPALLAGGLLLGMANVAAQFTAAQTDLFTTGVFAAAFALWLAALRRGRCSVLGVMGAGLAFGAKGTLFYLAPGALLWVAWLVWRHRLSVAQWRQTVIAAALGFGLFAAPALMRNWRAYGDPLGPAVWVKKHHQGFDSLSGQAHKIYWNIAASLAQNLAAQSQPPGLQALASATGFVWAETLPREDPYTLGGLSRVGFLEKIFGRARPDADTVGFGVVALGLFTFGTVAALRRWREEPARLTLVWSAGTVTFLLFFHVMQQWHPFGFRYFVLVGPWIAVVGAWGVEQLRGRVRIAAWALLILASAAVCWRVTAQTHQIGWQTVIHPERSLGSYVTQRWTTWSRSLDHADTPFVLALPEERPVGAFYRQAPSRAVRYVPEPGAQVATAEDFVRGKGGWVIVSASRFLGREGHVAASVWLHEGDPASPFSVAAFRQLGRDEKPRPVVYLNKHATSGDTTTFDLLIKTFGAESVPLVLTNPAARDLRYVISTPLGSDSGALAAGARLTLAPALAEGEVSMVKLFVAPAPSATVARPGEPGPELEILPPSSHSLSKP